MSSTIFYRWGVSFESPEVALMISKEFFTWNMNRSIDDVKKLIKKHSHIFKNINELVNVLKNYRDNFLSSYTLDIYKSPNHAKWVDERMKVFNNLVLKTKEFLKFLDIELSGGVSLDTLKSILLKVPQECNNLKKEIEEKIKEIEILIKQVEDAKNRKDLQELERLYQKMPEFLKEERQKLSKEILKLKLKESQKGWSEEKQKAKEDKEVENQKQKAQQIYEKLSRISQSEAFKLKPLMEELKESKDRGRISLIVSQIKYSYIKAVEDYVLSEVLKEDVRSSYAHIEEPKAREMIEEFLRKEKVSREEYENLIRKIRELLLEEEAEKERKKKMEEAVKLTYQKLRELGYYSVDENLMEKLLAGEIVEIGTPFGEDYVLRIRLDKETSRVGIRFVRYVEDENDLSEYEKAKDVSIAKEWCGHFDKLVELLKKEGIFLEDVKRIEPEQRFYYEKKEKRRERMEKIAKEKDRLRRQL